MGLPYELQVVDLAAGENQAPTYRAVNPYGRVPALRVGEQVVVESGACLMFLADRFPEKGFAPGPDEPARGAYVECFFTVLASLEPALLEAMGAPGDPGRGAAVAAELAGLEARLGRGPWVAGARVSAADVLLHGELWWMQMAVMPIPEACPRLDAYYRRHQEYFAWTPD